MSYEMCMQESNFLLKKEKVPFALRAIKLWFKDHKGFNGLTSVEVEQSFSLEFLMYRLCYRIGANGNGDYVSIDFIGNYLKEDKTIFDAIAPYVEDESYIQMKGGR